MEWFAAQPNTIQAAILDLYPQELRKGVAELLLEKKRRNVKAV